MIKRLLCMVVVVSRVYPFQASFRDTEPSCLRKISVLLWLCRTLELAFGCTWRRYVSNYRYSLLRVKPCSQHTNWTELNCRACTAAMQPIDFATLTRVTNNASCNWVNSAQGSSVQFSSVRLLWTRLYNTPFNLLTRSLRTDLMKLRGYCVTNFTLYTDHVRCGARDQTDF